VLLHFCGTRAFKRDDIPWRKKKYTNLLDLFIWFTGLVYSSLAFIFDICGLDVFGVVLVQPPDTRTTLLRLTRPLTLFLSFAIDLITTLHELKILPSGCAMDGDEAAHDLSRSAAEAQ